MDLHGIIDISLVLRSELSFDEKREIIKNSPISYYEVLVKKLDRVGLTKIYELATKLNLSDLEDAVLANNKEKIKDLVACHIPDRIASNGIPPVKNSDEMEKILDKFRDRALENIDNQENEVKKQNWFKKEKERLQRLTINFDIRFFENLKAQFDSIDYSFEYAVIKLVAKLESKLKSKLTIDDQDIDLEELINKFYCEECDKSALHTLRKTRNNYLHPTKEEFNFTRDMFDNCLKIVFRD